MHAYFSLSLSEIKKDKKIHNALIEYDSDLQLTHLIQEKTAESPDELMEHLIKNAASLLTRYGGDDNYNERYVELISKYLPKEFPFEPRMIK